jgi:hypothetical protein
MDRSSNPSLDEARTLYTKFVGRDGDDAIRAMADIALLAKRQQTGRGRLRLEALSELGRFLIRNGRGRGRPAKTSADEDKLYLADLGITDHHLSSDAKKSRGSLRRISIPIWGRKTNRPLPGCSVSENASRLVLLRSVLLLPLGRARTSLDGDCSQKSTMRPPALSG